MSDETRRPVEQWPGVSVAYEFVLPSYTWLVARFEAADTRLTVLLTLAATLTIGVPVLADRQGISFSSAWFLVAIVSFFLGTLVGLVGRVYGTLKLPDPMLLYERSLHKSEWDFKKDAIWFAGEHFAGNRKAVRQKGNAAAALAGLLALEIICLIFWIAQG